MSQERLSDERGSALVRLTARERSAWTLRHAGRQYAVFDVGGEPRVTDAACPHHGGPLARGTVSDAMVTCPWHRYSFDLGTGECGTVPGYRLRLYPVVSLDGRWYARLPSRPRRPRWPLAGLLPAPVRRLWCRAGNRRADHEPDPRRERGG